MIWLIVVGIAALALLLVAFDYGMARVLGLRPRWVDPARHALGEAAYRVGARWDDFLDWLRVGH
ncbi:MAG TPA: hypothetical protein VGI54_11310 [Solirubrobacteraceae bacterium]